MLVEHRPSHLRYSNDPTAASLASSLRPTTAHRPVRTSDEPAASGGLKERDFVTLYPSIFAEESVRPTVGSSRIVQQLSKALAIAAQFALGFLWHGSR